MWIRLRRPAPGCQLETGELKGRCHGAADQREQAEWFRRLPGARPHHRVGRLAVHQGAAEHDRANEAVTFCDVQGQRFACVEVPDLKGVDPVPAGALAFAQKIIDLRQRAAAAVEASVAKRLTIPAALRMRRKRQNCDDASGSKPVISVP